jgi:hypothetical protein
MVVLADVVSVLAMVAVRLHVVGGVITDLKEVLLIGLDK